MDYNETLKYISDTPKFSKNSGNNELLKLLDYLKNPQDSLSFIHVAGTNGKGSVCAMTASILKKAGFKTGLYTSPYIEVFNERIQINNEIISDEELARVATTVKNAISQLGIELTVFAQITAMAFLYFKAKKCDIVVLETGLGGRLDATNVIKTPKAVVITKIGLDHTEYLGDTIDKIAFEKCGIIKDNTPVITCSSQEAEALNVIRRESEKHLCTLTVADAACPYKISLKGDYQQSNAALAVCLCRKLGILEEDIIYGLNHTEWPARYEFIMPNLIIDGAHNPDGIQALINSLKKEDKNVIFVTAMMQDKDIKKSTQIINEFAKKVITTQVNMPRCTSSLELSSHFTHAQNIPDCISAVNTALCEAECDDLVCVCGSLYLAGEIRRKFKK